MQSDFRAGALPGSDHGLRKSSHLGRFVGFVVSCHVSRRGVLASGAILELKARRISDVPAYLQQTEAPLYAGLRKAGIPEQ
jgi:hypothetical protein